MDRSVVGAESVLVVAIIDSNLDRNRCVNQTDDRGRNSDKVGVPSVCRTSKSKSRGRLVQARRQYKMVRRRFWDRVRAALDLL
jgi:hypothetical protein